MHRFSGIQLGLEVRFDQQMIVGRTNIDMAWVHLFLVFYFLHRQVGVALDQLRQVFILMLLAMKGDEPDLFTVLRNALDPLQQCGKASCRPIDGNQLDGFEIQFRIWLRFSQCVDIVWRLDRSN